MPPPQPQQDGGFLSRLKNTFSSATNALLGSFDGSAADEMDMGPPQRYLPPSPPRPNPNLNYPAPGRPGPPQYPPGPRQGPPPGPMDPMGHQMRYPPRGPPPGPEGIAGGLLGKIKSIFTAEEGPGAQTPPPLYRGPPKGPARIPPSYGPGRFPPPPGGWPPRPRDTPPTPQTRWEHPPPGPETPEALPGPSEEPLRDTYRDRDTFRDRPYVPNPPQGYGAFQEYPPPGPQTPPFPEPQGPEVPPEPQQPPQEEQDPLAGVPSEPLVFACEDSIAIILRPRDFYRKKQELQRGGPQSLQVLTDFEHVLTRFRLQDGSGGVPDLPASLCVSGSGPRTVGSAELLESSPALHPAAQQQLLAAAEAFEALLSDPAHIPEGGEERAFEELTARCQAIVGRDGGLHIASIAPVTREGLSRLGLRSGSKEVLSALSARGVPVYVFSSGYGDVVGQALLQGGLVGSGGLQMQAQLPPNLRIISNFFRAGPDGTVRAFSHPMVHERNKNASTAASVLGMPLPRRPHALLLAAHEDDAAAMTHGLFPEPQDGGTVLSVGLLEVGEDLPQRLPAYLTAFDVVLVGDGSLGFVRNLLEDLLQLPRGPGKDGGLLGPAGGLGLLRKGLFGKLMGNSGAGEEPEGSYAGPGYGGYEAQQPQQLHQAPQPHQPQEFGEGKSYMHYGDF